jgi:hypothetical protein
MSNEFFLGKRSAAFAYAVEPSYGTENAATTWAWPGYVENFAPSDDRPMVDLTPMDGTDARTVAEYYPEVPSFGGTLKTKLQYGRMLAVLGIGTDSMTGSDPYTHEVGIGTFLPSFCFQAGHLHSSAPFGKKYTGAMVKKWDLNFPQGGFVDLTYDIVAQNVVKITTFKDLQTSATPLKKYLSSSVRNYRASDATFTINNVDVSAVATQGRLSMDNHLRVDAALDASQGSYALTRGSDSITFDFTGTKISRANEPIDIGGGVVIQDVALRIPTMTMTEINTLGVDYDTVCV